MLNQDSEENRQDVIELPNDDPNVFERFIKLADIAVSEECGGVGYLFEDSAVGLRLLKNTYLLAHKYNATKVIDLLQNLEMDLPAVPLEDFSAIYELNKTVKPVWSDYSIAQMVHAKATTRSVCTKNDIKI
eukprot:Platyproteum_vivax@DN17152_c0_g1_i1.p1